MAKTTNSTAPMAQTALKTMDTKGEQPMLDYVRQNLDDLPPEHQPQPGCMVLADHSLVIATKHTYLFVWSHDGAAVNLTRRRDPHRSPEPHLPHPRPVHMNQWPNDHTVLQRTLLAEQNHLYRNMDTPPEHYDEDAEVSLITTQEMYRLFPDLPQTVQKALTEGHTDRNFTEMEYYESAAATELEILLKNAHWPAIRELLRDRIKNLPEEEGQC